MRPRARRPQLKRDPLGSGTMEEVVPQLPSLGLCQECKANPAVYLVLPTRGALALVPGCDHARLGITVDGKCHLDLGRGPEPALSLCDDCARTVPENAKWRFAT